MIELIRSARRLWKNRIPSQAVIQVTDRCNARCPQCGMRVTETFPRSTLPMDDLRRIIDHAAEKGVQVISFTGGEPLLLLEDVAALIRHAGRAGIRFIRTGTNGFLFARPDSPGFEARVRRTVEALASTPLRNFWISVDSAVPEVHERMRGFPDVIRGVEKALPYFHEAGLYPSANLGINRNMAGDPALSGLDGSGHSPETFYHACRSAFRRFFDFVIDLGFTAVNVCYPMSVEEPEREAGLNAVYGAAAADRIVRFSRREKSVLFKALGDMLPEVRPRIRAFSPLCSLLALHRQYADNGGPAPNPCRGGIDFFFIEAGSGHTYPCGYRGRENLGRFWELDPDRLDPDRLDPDAASCLLCDWECFRDPSELFSPLLQVIDSPFRTAARWKNDPEYLAAWIHDMRYYFACNLFDGRVPPDFKRLKRFSPQSRAENPRFVAQSL